MDAEEEVLGADMLLPQSAGDRLGALQGAPAVVVEALGDRRLGGAGLAAGVARVGSASHVLDPTAAAQGANASCGGAAASAPSSSRNAPNGQRDTTSHVAPASS